MNRNEFFASVKQNNIAPVYLFQGPEEFVKARAVQALRDRLLPDGLEMLNESVLEGATADTILAACETLPVMCDRRLVLVRDFAPLMSGRVKNEAAEAEIIASFLNRAPESCCLVFSMRESVDARKKASQSVLKAAQTVQFEYLDASELLKWTRAKLKPLGISIDPDALSQLSFFAGRALTRIDSELDKLAAYAKDRGEISMADVRAIVPPSLESNVFQLIDHLMEKRMAEAQRLLHDMMEGGETPLAIMAMITRQMRMLTHIKRLSSAGRRLNEIERELEMNHYAAAQAARQAERYTADSLEKGYRACVEADYSVKSGGARDIAALDRLIFTLRKMS